MIDAFTSLPFDIPSGLIGTAIISLMILAWRRVDPEAARRHVGRFGGPAATAAFVLAGIRHAARPAGAVAIRDSDRVARTVGWDSS